MTLFRILRRVAFEQGLNPVIAAVLAGLVLLTALVYPFIWQRKQHRAGFESGPALSFWLGLVRYGIALDLAMFGVQKWFGLQASNPLALLDEPFSSFNGEALSWAYFGYSYPFLFVIGAFQVFGSLFLVFGRTRLLGVFVLMPVMVNICLMNFFYHFEVGEQVHALILLVGLLFLLLQDYRRLAALFFGSEGNFGAEWTSNVVLKNMGRFSVLHIPFLLILLFFNLPKRNPLLDGKYQVGRLWMNEELIDHTDCRDSLLSRVYFDKGNQCVFEYNSQGRRLFGKYGFDRLTQGLHIVWHYPREVHDTLDARVVSTPGGLGLAGSMGHIAIRMELKKL